MTEVFKRYSAKAPEPISTQFRDRVDKQSAVKGYQEKCEKRSSAPLFPTGMFSVCLDCFMVFTYRVRTGHGKPGKSWNFVISFSRPGSHGI